MGALVALASTQLLAKGPAELTGGRPDIYLRLADTPGNIVALEDRTLQLESRIGHGLTPAELELFFTYPVHPVQAGGKFAQTPGISPVDAIPVSPGLEAPPITPPGDILNHVDAGLRQSFKGFANLSMMAGDGTIGLTTEQGSQVSYQLDNRFLTDQDVVLSPTTPVLTVTVGGTNEAEKQQAESYLSQIRQSLLTSLPTAMTFAGILMALGVMVVSALRARGYQAQYEVVNANIPMMTNAFTVSQHENQHVKDFLSIQRGTMPIQQAYLLPTSPLYGVSDSLMEVRAGLAEYLSGGETNWPYLAVNAANLQKALISTPMMPPDLYAMALQDLQYAQYVLQENNGQLINF